ncbi:MAG: low molecular weight protein arginine phosphatase [Clostridia bacterium]|nr:low molecular weight protein arginine phosphatase [Clostridia bacterium]
MILFICTGNTCRSPMAQALACSRGHQAQSAGLQVPFPSPASPEARKAAERRGLSLENHIARQVTGEMLARAEKIYPMTCAHARMIQAYFPEYAEKIHPLSPEIPDPFGGDEMIYESCIQRIEAALIAAGL